MNCKHSFIFNDNHGFILNYNHSFIMNYNHGMVATAQGKQGIWFLLFPDRENTGNFAVTQGTFLRHRENILFWHREEFRHRENN